MFNFVSGFLFIFLTSMPALSSQNTDNTLRSIAEYISLMSSGPCSHILLDNAQALYSAGAAQNCPTSRSFGSNPSDGKEIQSKLFFELAQKAYAQILQCEYDKLKHYNFDNPFMTYELASRSEALKDINKKIGSLTAQWQLLNGQIPKSTNIPLSSKQITIQNRANLINEDLKNLMDQKNMIIATTPFGQHPEVQRFMEYADFSKSNENSLRIQLRSLRASVFSEIAAAKKTADSKDPLPSVVKESIVQDPIMMDYILKKNNLKKEEHKSLLCYLDSVYGEGAKKRDTAITVVTTVAGFGAGSLITRALVAAWRTGRISAAAWSSTKNASVLVAGATGTTFGLIDSARAAEKECKDHPNFNLNAAPKNNQCDGAAVEREIEEANCFLGFTLPLMGSALSFLSMPKELAALQSLTARFKERRDLKLWLNQRKPQYHFQNLIKMRQKGDNLEAAEYERKLKAYMENNEVVDRKRVGKGVSDARYVEFPDGTVGIWKKATTQVGKKTFDSGNSELAAYQLDNYLGYHRVPITISKKLNGEDGTVQLLVDNLGEFRKGSGQEEMSLFDYLIHNFDRTNNPDNMLFTADAHIVGIDHGFAFSSRWPSPPTGSLGFLKEQANAQPLKKASGTSMMDFNAAKSQRDQLLVAIVGDKDAYEKLKSTTPEDWKKFFSTTLSEKEIDNFLNRRLDVINAVDGARNRFGDSIFRGPHSPIRVIDYD